MSITATPDPRTASVELTISSAAGVTGIIRADITGTRRVRLREDELPAAGKLTVTDYEPALTGRIQYRLEGIAGDVWTEVGAELPRFHIPAIPQFQKTVDMVTTYAAERESRSIFHDVINRDDPLVSEGRMRPRSGSMDIWVETYQDGRDLEDVLERGKVVHFRQAEHPGMDMYFHASRLGLAPEEDNWKLSLSYREVAPPSGYVISTKGWTFNTLRDANEDFEAIAADYRTFVDVAIGEKS